MKGRPLAVLEMEDVEAVLPLMAPQDLYFVIQEAGMEVSAPLVRSATAGQIKTFVDLDVWLRDRIVPERLLQWLELTWEAGGTAFVRTLRTLDAELLALLVADGARVLDLTLQEIPEGLKAGPMVTADTFYALIPADEDLEKYRSICDLVDRIYLADRDLGHSVVKAALWDMPSVLEEQALKFRRGRLSDQGFAGYYEALAIYAYLKPSSVKVGENTAEQWPVAVMEQEPPSIMSMALTRSSEGERKDFFDRCLERIDDPGELQRLGLGAARLTNLLIAADAVVGCDLHAAMAYAARARRYLSLGLEYLCRQDPLAGPEALRTVALLRVYRLGFSLTLDLKGLVLQLRGAGRISLAPEGTSLLDPPWDALTDALTGRSPELVRELDPEPGEGPRPFETLSDIGHAARLVEDLASLWPLCFRCLEFPPGLLTPEGLVDCVPSDPAELSLGDLFRTAAARALLGQQLQPLPLSPKEVERAAGAAARIRARGGTVASELVGLVRERVMRSEAADDMKADLERIVRIWCAPLERADEDTLAGCVLTQRKAGRGSGRT